MNEFQRKTSIKKNQRFGEWLLDIFLIQYDENEKICENEIDGLISKYLEIIENHLFSDEYIYFKTGFVFLHFGKRGIDLSFIHFGKWGSTFEMYECSWYCYGRNTDTMEMLDAKEPIMCQYEFLYFIDEINKIKAIVNCEQQETFQKAFLNL